MNFGVLTLFDDYPEEGFAQDYYRFLLEEIGYAEELGFETVWLGEHHFCNYLCPSSQVFAAAVAQRTTRLRIGTGDAEECIDRIAHTKEAVGNTHYWLYADLGGLPREEVWASLRRFAEKGMPKFR
ncbi:MAG: LLM class flavin-dependent oxidoreductase [Deltaproteobacteria bacterium]|nr:LLM class flavin-dependent oxidoreductase [Deltaproteobacteria bacterium]